MKHINKKSIRKFSQRYLNATNIKFVVLLIPLVILFLKEVKRDGFIISDFLDTSILISFLTVFLFEGLASLIHAVLDHWTEDAVKLDVNYKDLVKKYTLEKKHMVGFKKGDDDEVVFPEIVLYKRKIGSSPVPNYHLELNESRQKYELPEQVADNSEKIMQAHRYSTVYNNINIRMDDFVADGDDITIKYSYTTYFDSLITNRAMDFPFSGGRSVREIYEPGPMLSSLTESKLSNHLGFNGFVELSDGKIIFVHRGGKVSIGKGTWSDSIGASLKCMYCLGEDRKPTMSGFSNAIRKEIKDELAIEIPEKTDMIPTIFAFYRELVEGGKPQFLFYYKVQDKKLDEEKFKEEFKKHIEDKRKENKKKVLVDGVKFEFFTLEELRHATINIDSLEYGGKKLKMVPSCSASVKLLLDALS